MRMVFIESREFTDWVAEFFSNEDFADLQRNLLDDPTLGDLISGCGGLRKLGLAAAGRGRGKWGGARVIYLHVEEVDQIDLITVYAKGQRDNLSAEDRKL